MNTGKKTYEAFDLVTEFHRLNGQLINDKVPTQAVPDQVGILRSRLIIEEFGETIVALHEKNLVEFADGLADLLYVLLGTAVSFGVPVEDRFYDGTEHVKNLQVIGSRPTWTFMRGGSKLLHLLADRLYDTTECSCPRPDCPGKTADETSYQELQELLQEACEFVCAVAAVSGIPLKEVFLEVHRANLSKKLGGATDGRKYGEGGGKGVGYTPPDVKGILARVREAQKMEANPPETASVN
jgi:predicted HAD superfamily Cof-like phosphohydrolase